MKEEHVKDSASYFQHAKEDLNEQLGNVESEKQIDEEIKEGSLNNNNNDEQVEREEESKRKLARQIDKQYQRSIVVVRDTHLFALQREHEQRSQVEERKV